MQYCLGTRFYSKSSTTITGMDGAATTSTMGTNSRPTDGKRQTSVVSAATILMAGFLLSRLLGILRVTIQGRVLGVHGVDATAFTTAIAIPDFVFTIVSGGAVASSFIPIFIDLLNRDDEERAWRVASGVLNIVLFVLLVAVSIAEVGAPDILRFMHGYSYQALTLTRIMLLQPLFLALSGILMGIHNSYHRFIAPAVAPLVYNAANIIGLLLIPVFGYNLAPAAWGVTVGALLQVLVMLPGLALFRQVVRPGSGIGDPGTREVGRLMVPRVVGQAGIQFSGLVTIALANGFTVDKPAAAIRTAGYLFALPVGMFGGAVATAAFPTLAGQAARNEFTALGVTISRTLRTMLFLATPAAIALIVLRHPLVDVLLRGGRFDAHDVDLVTAALVPYAAGIPVWTAVELLPRAFFALKDTWTPVLVNIVTLIITVICSVVGVRLAAGNSIVGVALLTGSLSLGVVFEVVWLGLLLRRRVRNLGLRDLGLSCLRSLVAGEAMGVTLLALLYLWYRYAPSGNSILGEAALLCIAIPLGIGVYAGWSYVIGAPELATAWAATCARLRRH